MVINGNIKSAESAANYVCEICDFKCSKTSDYKRHLATDKHKMVTNGNPAPPQHICECGSTYKHCSGLSRHKKKCNHVSILDTSANEVVVLSNLVIELVRSNGDLQKQMLEVCKSSTTNNSNNNNCNNKTFNLRLYLNETCKDAMNIMEFVESIKFQLSDLESIGELGYINGLSKVIIRNLKALDENMRPVHCSDLRREKIYIKDDGKWEKESVDNKILKNAIKFIAYKNVKMIPAFREKYPDCIYSDSRKSDQYNRLIIEAMGGDGNDEDEKANKIIKRIAKEILIDK
jgi:hypothetical protein